MHHFFEKRPRSKMKSVSLVLSTLLIITTIGFTLLSHPGSAAAATTTLSFAPAADSYVDQSNPGTNYGVNSTLRIDGSPLVRSYLRFSVSGLVSGSVTKATLKIYANSQPGAGFTVYTVANTTWLETQITYSNAPVMGSAVATSPTYAANSWASVDVTSLVKGNGVYSLALAETNQTAVSLAARESGSHAPVLVVETSSASTPTSTTLPGTPTASQAPTNPPGITPTPAGDFQPAFPIRAAFFYPWFPEAWNQQGYNPFTNYHPSSGFYDSGSVSMIQNQITAMSYGNINGAILSWWGQGSPTDSRVATILGATPASSNPHFRWSLYYENESAGDPSVTQLQSDISYIGAHYGSNPSFLRVNGKFVMFVYADGNDACAMASRWVQADNALGHPAYIVLKVFAGYKTCASQPDSWHQYSPAVATDDQAGYSYAIAPGFYKMGDAVRLARDLTRWNSNVQSMVASHEPWQLVTTFNEWGEGTSVESATEWQCASGYGLYMDALHANGGGVLPQPTATKQPTTPPGATATATKPPAPTSTVNPTQQVTATRTSTQGATATPKPTATANPTQPVPTATQPSNLTLVSLTKGPDLLFSGSNTQMKVFWQWTANTTFRVDWGSSSYGTSSPSISAYDTTNHLYAYTVTGLTPGTRYYYRVVVGSQYSPGTFLTAPAAGATTVNFVSYGDNRSNPNTQNAVAGLVDQLFQSDPSYQTFNLVCGDLVSNGDTDSTWTSEMFTPSLTNVRTELANLSYLPIMGNHEGSGSLFVRYFPQPYVASAYWSFDYGPVHVTMMDQYVSYGSGSAEYNWVKNDLATTTKKWKVVVFHEPGWSANGGHANNTTIQSAYEPLFEQNNVALVISGHNHYYARAMVNGIPELTIGTGGAPFYTPQSGQPNIVKTYQGNGYARFSINGNTLTGSFISTSGSTIDTFTVTR